MRLDVCPSLVDQFFQAGMGSQVWCKLLARRRACSSCQISHESINARLSCVDQMLGCVLTIHRRNIIMDVIPKMREASLPPRPLSKKPCPRLSLEKLIPVKKQRTHSELSSRHLLVMQPLMIPQRASCRVASIIVLFVRDVFSCSA